MRKEAERKVAPRISAEHAPSDRPAFDAFDPKVEHPKAGHLADGAQDSRKSLSGIRLLNAKAAGLFDVVLMPSEHFKLREAVQSIREPLPIIRPQVEMEPANV